jgi:hypothetical protein
MKMGDFNMHKRTNFFLFSIIFALALQFLPFVCRAAESATVNIIKLNNYDTQDGVRDSIRFALYRVSNSNLSFWGREYPINAGFYNHGDIRTISILKDHPDLHYKLWLQDEPAPLVTIFPGMGSHFQGMGVNAMAQVYFNAGFSVVIISSAMNWEFYLAASRSKAPGYVPHDVLDIHNALLKIVAEIKKDNPGKIKSLHLVGYSLGGLHTLFLAELESRTEHKIGFSSYLAIHPPVDPYSSMFTLDDFFDKWKKWQKKDVPFKIESAVAAYLSLIRNGLPDKKKSAKVKIPLEEAKVLIAYAYRNSLRELMLAICSSGNDMGFIREQYGFTKNTLYNELSRYSFAKYAEKLVKKSAAIRTGKSLTMKKMAENSNLNSIRTFLEKANNISLIHSLDDFLINKNDVVRFSKIFGKNAYFFRYGGHLGELYTPEAKVSIVKHLVIPK